MKMLKKKNCGCYLICWKLNISVCKTNCHLLRELIALMGLNSVGLMIFHQDLDWIPTILTSYYQSRKKDYNI